MKRFVFSFTLLAAIAANSVFSQSLFEGKLIYTQRMSGGVTSETEFVEYHKGDYFVSDIPGLKTKLIYRSDLQELISIQSVTSTPIVTKKKMPRGSDDTPLIFHDSVFSIMGYSCVFIEYETKNEMMHGKTSVWIDTSFKIPFNYGVFSDVEYGLVVKSESELVVKGITMHTSKVLQNMYYGDVDIALFAIPQEDNTIVVRENENGNIIYRDCDSSKIKEILTSKYGENKIEKITDNNYYKKVKNGYVLLDFGAKWCGPCRLLEPRLEKIALQYRKSLKFFKMDIEESPIQTNRLNVRAVPTVILLKDGVEIDRIVGGLYSEKEISDWIKSHLE